jgi:uncharacterized protein YndB with AHSA1/START domain
LDRGISRVLGHEPRQSQAPPGGALTSSPIRSARAVADLSGGLVLASVEIAAPPERVFRAISSAEIADWWGSADTYRVTRWTGEVRPGGWWKSEGVSADGKSFAVSGDVLEVEPPHLLVQTWHYEDKPAEITTVRFRIDSIPGGSRLTVRHEGFVDHDSCDSHGRGWERVLGWLSAFVTR